MAVLKETWSGETDLPYDLGKTATEFMQDLKQNLALARSYSDSHAQREQNHYATQYNLRSKDKHFSVGEKVLVLSPDSTASKVYSRWKGPAEIIEIKSPYSYVVECDGHRQYVHTN